MARNMTMARLRAILACLPCGAAEPQDSTVDYANEKAPLLSASGANPRPASEIAEEVVATLLTTSLAGPVLHMKLDSIVGAYGWRTNIAKHVLENLTAALQSAHDKLGPSIRIAYDKAWEAATSIEGFVIEHPVMCTVIAFGVLAVIAPWVLEALGFSALGPVEGTCYVCKSLPSFEDARKDAFRGNLQKAKEEENQGNLQVSMEIEE
jgi:hypothetical protein